TLAGNRAEYHRPDGGRRPPCRDSNPRCRDHPRRYPDPHRERRVVLTWKGLLNRSDSERYNDHGRAGATLSTRSRDHGWTHANQCLAIDPLGGPRGALAAPRGLLAAQARPAPARRRADRGTTGPIPLGDLGADRGPLGPGRDVPHTLLGLRPARCR